jgi:hypothetical protein
MRNDRWKQVAWGCAALALCALPGLPGLAGCPGPGGAGGAGGSGPGARAARAKKSPAVTLQSFDGLRGVFRIHNGTGRTIRRVAVGLRGVGCEGPRATRTEVKVFDLRLRPGARQSFAFTFEHRCRRAHVAVSTQ